MNDRQRRCVFIFDRHSIGARSRIAEKRKRQRNEQQRDEEQRSENLGSPSRYGGYRRDRSPRVLRAKFTPGGGGDDAGPTGRDHSGGRAAK
jgi:hypothetical protein